MEKVSMEETSELVLDFKMKGVPGVPIPPSRVVAMTSAIDKKKKRLAYQEETWKCLATVIDDLVGSLSATNVCSVAASLFAENLIRGKGLFCAACMKHQMLSPQNTDVIAVLVFIINAHIPVIGFILLRRLMFTFNLARLSRNMMKELRAVTKFMVHLSNKHVIDYHITKDLFLYLLNDGAEEYVLVAAELFKELDLSFKSHHFMDDRQIKRHFKGVHRYFIKKIHKGQLGDNVKHLIKGLLINWDAKFQEKPSARSELDWLKPRGIFCHFLFREYSIDEEITRDIFIPDPLFHEREMAYEFFKRDLLLQGYWLPHTYKTKNFLELRRAIESLVWSPLKEDIERIGHELLQKLEPGGEMELCWLILEYCYRDSQADYVLHYSFLAEYLCKVNKLYQENFYKCFFIMWFKVAGLGLAGFRSLAMFFSGLLAKDLLSWHVLAALQVTVQDMAKSSEYFVECLFKELEKQLTMNGLISRLLNPSLQDVFDALLPQDGVRDSKYFVQFFKSIDMGRIPKSMMRHSIGRAVSSSLASAIPIHSGSALAYM